MSKLKKSFYLEEDVVSLARKLLGKKICTYFQGQLTSGLITETEAYAGITDRGSHAFGNRRTSRTQTMYLEGGHAYVYLCYGIHALFNIVTNKTDIPHAILLRGIKAVDGIETMTQRSGKAISSGHLFDGPGKLTVALGINLSHNALNLVGNKIWIEEAISFSDNQISITPRIGIDYAAEDALLPYRFVAKKP